MQSSSPHAVADAHDIIWVNQQPCLSIALPSTWETYLARLGRKMRQNLSYYDRLLQRTFEVVEKRLAEQPELPEAMSALFELHQKRWQRRRLCGHLGSQQVQAFHRQIAERFYERDWLRLHDLRVGGRIVAIEYAFCFRERYATYLTGFDPDPEWQRYSIGTVTSAEAVRQAIVEGCQVIDFLRGKDATRCCGPRPKASQRDLPPATVPSHAMVSIDSTPGRGEPAVSSQGHVYWCAKRRMHGRPLSGNRG
jgi:CelD/BcsL family acetyltransferase involved in cellulose biosynthesis